MITEFDDYPIHQAPVPVAQPASTDKSFYDRYWFNGFDKEGGFYFGIALGLYPNLGVMDGHFSFVKDGVQHSFHASRRAPGERGETRIGPFSIHVDRPMRVIEVRLEPNDTGVECNLVFRARTVAHEEPHSVLREDNRVILDTCRFTQFGTWEGEIKGGGETLPVTPDKVVGVRDRSWGIRPVGPPVQTAPAQGEPGVFWLWSVNHFDDLCTHFGTFQDHDGRPTQQSGVLLPAYGSFEEVPRGQDPGAEEMARSDLRITWEKGTRRVAKAEIDLFDHDGAKQTFCCEPLIRFHMKGLGYLNPEWAHGVWKGEEVIGGETWNVDDLDPLLIPHLHIQQVCRVRMGDRVGVGALEQLVIGRHGPSGFKSLMDGAE